MSLVSEGSQRLEVLGVPVDAVDMAATLEWVEQRIDRREAGTHLCVNAANIVRANEDPDYLELLERSTLVGADGQPIVWAARATGHRLPGRVAGIDLMEQVLRQAKETGWGVYLLGAQPDIVNRLAEQLLAEGVDVVGYRDGYFSDEEAPEIADKIAKSGADVLFVGMPSPIKERFVVSHAGPAGIPVCIGVGGSFDVLVGELRRAPVVLQRTGMEWLFRLLQEPRRLFWRYAVTNSRFLALVGRSLFRRPRRGTTR